MEDTRRFFLLLLLFMLPFASNGEDAYRFFTWNVSYGNLAPLGVMQTVILINGQFPGPSIETVTNENLIISVFNSLDEPFLLTWNGLLQRRNSWQDGVYGTNCPVPPKKNFTYILQVKDQIGSFFYFPSLAFHKAAGGFGRVNIQSRSVIPVPFPQPAAEFSILAGDWFNRNHTDLRMTLDSGKDLASPDGVLINGKGSNSLKFAVEKEKTYRFRISNVGITSSINFGIQGHTLLLVEVEGTHTLQNTYTSIDIHIGQSCSVILTADQAPADYNIVLSTRFTPQILNSTAILRYRGSGGALPLAGDPVSSPASGIDWSLEQARSIRQNLTASGPRPNPQGSYHYGLINTTRTIKLSSSTTIFDGKKRYAVNGVSFIPADTPLKLADYFNIPGVFSSGDIESEASGVVRTSAMDADFRSFVEVVFENGEAEVQSWHVDGNIFFVVGMDGGSWNEERRGAYNLRDGISRSTVQVYPRSWTAVYMPLDNVGMWNVRSAHWVRQYLGQQFYLRVRSLSKSWRDEYPMPSNALLCGRAVGRV